MSPPPQCADLTRAKGTADCNPPNPCPCRQLLEHYGFMLEDNPHDTAQLPLELVLAHAGSGRASGSSSSASPAPLLQSECFVHANGRPSWGLLRALR